MISRVMLALLAVASATSLLVRVAPRAGTIVAAAGNAALTALEQRAVGASESWETVVTEFLTPDLVEAAEELFDGRADIGFVKIGTTRSSSASRARFVLTNPELVDSLGSVADLAAEYCVLLRVSAAFDKSGNKFGAGGHQASQFAGWHRS